MKAYAKTGVNSKKLVYACMYTKKFVETNFREVNGIDSPTAD